MIEFENVVYELKFSLKRIQMIENVIKKPIMSVLQNGFMTIQELTVCCAYGMKKDGADAFIDPKKGFKIIEQLLEEDGAYFSLSDKLAEVLERDCPFFFRAG